MSGKSYTIREMKTIVDYLTTHGLYGETKGRKMWMDFANSNHTERTWQSLKETFLKRILPDITNPYFKLMPEEILSFKRGVNLTQKDRKLELRPVNSSINKGASDIDQPSTSKNITEENATGEDTQCSKLVHNRASTETLVLDTCYQTAEDMQSDLESANEDNEIKINKTKPPLKSVRDFIEYTEPLTPMLQEVLHDFATDEDCSDTEPPMQIDENYVAPDEIFDNPENPSSQSILQPNKTQNKLTTAEENDNVKQLRNTKQDNENTEKPVVAPDDTAFSQLDDVMVLVDEALAKGIDNELSNNIESQDKEVSSNQSIPMTDSLLPNNQEAIKTASPLKSQSPILSSAQKKHEQGIVKEESRVGKKLSNSQTNLVSDQEPENKGPTEVTEIDSNNKRSHNRETTPETPAAQNTDSPKKPHITDVQSTHSDSSTGTKDVDPQVDNPCLKSVSLFEQQLVATQYSDSDSYNKENASVKSKIPAQNNAESNKNIDIKNNETGNQDENIDKAITKEKTTEGVILLNSRTTSESVDDCEIPHRPLARSSLKIQKDKKLASVFGFSNGGVQKSRRMNGRKRTTSHRIMESDSSEWTSTSDSEYVSPPRGRRNRYSRRYQKPRAARIMSLEEEGGLFVMLGKKVYPLVKDGKLLKNYVTYLPDSDPEEDDSYWKSKYIEERKRSDELKKKLGNSKSNGVLDKEEKESSISVSSVTSPLIENGQGLQQDTIQGNELMRRYSTVTEKQSNKETLKIKFTRNDQEVQLEGHWQHINPVLAQVVSILHKDSTEKKADAVTCVELSSGNTTPITPTVTTHGAPMDTGVHDKVNELESAIFKEIEEKDKKEEVIHEVVEQKEMQEQNEPVDNVEQLNSVQENVEEQSHITQRKKRGRPKKEVSPALSIGQSPAKKPKPSKQNKIVEEVKALEVNSTPNVGRLTRSPRKLLNGIAPKARASNKSLAKVQSEAPVENTPTPVADEIEDDEVRYKFPSPEPETKATNTNKVSPKKHLPNTASPESLSHHSTTSSQGYQDSDTSPFNINIRRKRRLSISTLSIKGRKMKRKQRSRSYPLLKRINSDSDSSYIITFKTTGKEQSTINSEVYRSDSYQFLMPRSQTIERLEKIDEAVDNEADTLANEIRELRDEILKANVLINKTDPASSSVLSLPLSPELSIVENLSVSKSDVAVVDHPTINETQGNNAQGMCSNKYFLSEVDASMPLMEQTCEMKEKYRKQLMAALSDLSDAPNSAGRNLSRGSSMRMSITSESILKSYPAINVESSDSLDKRLERLLLESAQKPTNKEENMEVDTQVKKRGSRKRCSTPNKKKVVQNKKKVNQEPVIVEEESKVRCSRGGRRSCPPSVNIVYCEQNPVNNLEININDESIDVTTVTKRKRTKKDIIKVKIVKPKDKPQKKKSPKKMLQNASRTSITEGDNESGVFLHGFEDSSELIHNHSETCLQIGDCMGPDDSDSVEFIETTTKSIISLDSSTLASANKDNVSGNTMESGRTTPELYCDNAQCATDLREATRPEVLSADSGNTMYFTPFASRCNSDLTEDLSDDPPPKTTCRPSKWYLLEEDESNTNFYDVQEKESNIYGSNLQQIFPITCAIPDLSTITEMSEKNDNSQKASMDAEELRRESK